MWYVFIDMYVYRQYYSSMRRKEILSFGTTWIDLGDIMLCEISQTEKGKYCIISLICRIYKSKTIETDYKVGYQWLRGE